MFTQSFALFLAFLLLFVGGLLTLLFGGAGLPLGLLASGLLGLVGLGLAIAPAVKPFNTWQIGLTWGAVGLAVASGIGLLPATLSGITHPYSTLLAPLDITPAFATLGLAGVAAAPAWLLLLGYALCFAVVVRVATDEALAHRLLQGTALLILAFALYGLWAEVMGSSSTFGVAKTAYKESLTSTFISRNHTATLLGLGILTSLALLLRRVGEVSRQLVGIQRLKALWALVLRPGWPWLGVAMVQWLALILTDSRAGLAAVIVALGLFILVLAYARAAVRWWLLGGAAVLGMVGLLLLAVVGADLAVRTSTLATRDVALRQIINRTSDNATVAMPLWGHGLGAWAPAVAVTRQAAEYAPFMGNFGNAHNLYKQTLLELGWPGLLAMLALGGGIIAALLHGVQTRRRQVIYPTLGLAGLGLVLVHSLVDFPLHIPAVMVVSIIIVGVGVAQAFKAPEEAPAPQRFSLSQALFGLLALVVVGSSSYIGWALWPSFVAAGAVQQLRAGQTLPLPQLNATRNQLLQCTTRAPWWAACWDDTSLISLVQAQSVGLRSANGQVLLRVGELQGSQSLALNPTNPFLAYQLAQSVRLQGRVAAANRLLAHSVLTGPYESPLAIVRARLLLRQLAKATPATLSADDAALFKSNLRLLWQGNASALWYAVKDTPEAMLLATILAEGGAADLPAQWQKATHRAWPLAQGPLGNGQPTL